MAELTPTTRSVSLALTGSGGAGVITAGNMLLAASARLGWYGLFGRSAGPQIRGGEAAALIRLSAQPVESPDDLFDILIAIDWQNFERFAGELPLGQTSLVVADPDQGAAPDSVVGSGVKVVELPMKALAKSIKKGRQNMVALGAVAAMIGLPEDILVEVVDEQLANKGEEARRASFEAIGAGRRAAEGFGPDRRLERPGTGAEARWSISGNHAAGLGAVRGGVRFVAGYPITPATEMLEWMAPSLSKVGGALVQAEDELAAVNMIIGASYGGTPALTATSGPGLALMTESIGLAVAAEVPIVVVDVMRGGPSTGIPTKSEQSDLNIALFGLHGDAPHLVLAPTSISDCLFTTQWAVHLAESMQVPAILLSDQMMGQSRAVIDRPADLAFVARRMTAELAGTHDYRRYAVGAGGVSPMAVPGAPGGQYTADGLEHDEAGLPSGQVADHLAQLDKRRDKLDDFEYGNRWADVEGEGALAVITWGSTTGAVREALSRLRAKGLEVRLVALRLLAPLRAMPLADALDGVERALVVEQSHSAQFFHYLKGHCESPCQLDSYHRPGPRPMRPGELTDRIVTWSGS